MTTATASLAQAGDLLVIWVKALYVGNPQIQVTSISASGTGTIGTPVNAIQYYSVDHPNNDDEIWYAPVTHAGTIALTFTWSGSNSGDVSQYSTQEFQPSTPSTYSLDRAGHDENNTPTLTMQFPPLTPVGADELYAGYNSNGTTGTYTTPTTTGYTGETLADGDVILFDPDVSASTQSPSTAATSGASTQSSIGALIIATPNTSYTVTFNANPGSGTMANEADNTPTTLTLNAFTRASFTFSDWNTVAGGGGTPYADGTTYSFTKSTTLYAQWTTSGGGGGTPALGTLTISAATLTVTVGGTVPPTASVTSGLTSSDTGTVTSATFTYAGTGSTVYAASTTAPATAGTYSVTPSAATVTISPSADAADYSTTYTYVGSVLDINNPVVVVVVVPGPHATRVIGYAIVGESRTLTIVGRDFTVNPGVTSNQSGAVVRVHSKSANRIVLSITIRKGIRPGTHLFTITASGKKCKIGYVTR